MLSNEWTPPARYEWQDSANCAGTDPEIFFPENGGSTAPARKICAVCDVSNQCLEWALENERNHGILAGLTPNQRGRLARKEVGLQGVMEQIARLKAQGLANSVIGAQLHISDVQVGRLLRRHNLQRGVTDALVQS